MSRSSATSTVRPCPTALLADGDEVPLGDGRRLEVVWTPGHTPGHCCLLLQPDGILFVGDHLLPKITPHVGIGPNGPDESAGRLPGLAREDQAARRAAGLSGARRRLRGPSPPRRQLIDFHRVRKLTMLEVIRKRPCTAYEVALEAFAISPTTASR